MVQDTLFSNRKLKNRLDFLAFIFLLMNFRIILFLQIKYKVRKKFSESEATTKFLIMQGKLIQQNLTISVIQTELLYLNIKSTTNVKLIFSSDHRFFLHRPIQCARNHSLTEKKGTTCAPSQMTKVYDTMVINLTKR